MPHAPGVGGGPCPRERDCRSATWLSGAPAIRHKGNRATSGAARLAAPAVLSERIGGHSKARGSESAPRRSERQRRGHEVRMRSSRHSSGSPYPGMTRMRRRRAAATLPPEKIARRSAIPQLQTALLPTMFQRAPPRSHPGRSPKDVQRRDMRLLQPGDQVRDAHPDQPLDRSLPIPHRSVLPLEPPRPRVRLDVGIAESVGQADRGLTRSGSMMERPGASTKTTTTFP